MPIWGKTRHGRAMSLAREKWRENSKKAKNRDSFAPVELNIGISILNSLARSFPQISFAILILHSHFLQSQQLIPMPTAITCRESRSLKDRLLTQLRSSVSQDVCRMNVETPMRWMHRGEAPLVDKSRVYKLRIITARACLVCCLLGVALAFHLSKTQATMSVPNLPHLC